MYRLGGEKKATIVLRGDLLYTTAKTNPVALPNQLGKNFQVVVQKSTLPIPSLVSAIGYLISQFLRYQYRIPTRQTDAIST